MSLYSNLSTFTPSEANVFLFHILVLRRTLQIIIGLFLAQQLSRRR